MLEHGIAHIYVLIDPRTGEIRYVGWTTDPEHRLVRHLRAARRLRSHRERWLAKLQRQGLKPTLQVIQSLPLEYWAEAEVYWIAHFRERGCRLTNGTDGGEGTPGQKHTPETRARMSASARRRVRGPRGPMSEAQKSKLRDAAARQMADPEMREAVSRVHKGKTLSAEHRAATGQAAARRWEAWREGRFPADLVERYDSGETLAALAAECGVAHPTMKRELVARGAAMRGRWGHPATR